MSFLIHPLASPDSDKVFPSFAIPGQGNVAIPIRYESWTTPEQGTYT